MKHKKTIPIKRVETTGVLIEKKEYPFVNLAPGKGIPQPDPVFEVTFETPQGNSILPVSEFEYRVLEEGEAGTLVYEVYQYHTKLISFADKIKEID